MKRQTRGYMQAFETAASATTLWRALTDPEALRAWLATEAIVDPRAGGRYAMTRSNWSTATTPGSTVCRTHRRSTPSARSAAWRA